MLSITSRNNIWCSDAVAGYGEIYPGGVKAADSGEEEEGEIPKEEEERKIIPPPSSDPGNRRPLSSTNRPKTCRGATPNAGAQGYGAHCRASVRRNRGPSPPRVRRLGGGGGARRPDLLR